MQFNGMILPELTDRDSVYTVLRELDMLEESVYKSGEAGFEAVAELAVSKDTVDAVNESIRISGGNSDQSTRERVVRDMKKAITQLPVLRLEIAVNPTKRLYKKIHEWIRNNIGESVVLDLSVNPGLLAGTTIVYRGKYIDKSTAAKWAQIWQQISQELWGQKSAVNT